MFLVLILGFGPHVLITSDHSNLEIRQRPWALIEQGFLKIDYQQSYGINPRSVEPLASNQPEKKEAPVFAGATNLADDIGITEWQRQKKKPTGVDAWRTVV